MRYLPKSPAERVEMLGEIGASSIEELFAVIPAEYRLERDLAVPAQLGESEIIDFFKAAAAKNAVGYASFLGAGCYRHYRPVVIDTLVQRGEFLTSYTPYQAEITQGTLQAIFEFQTMICELTGMDVANASMYEGSTGAAEAVMMAARITGRSHSVVATSVHPEYREVMATYAQHQGLPSDTVGYDAETGRVDLAALDAAITPDTACVLMQSPNFFGVIEDVAAIAEIAHAKGALLVVSIAEALSLGVVKPPVEADQLRRAVLRSYRYQGKIHSPDAGTPRRPDYGCRWEPRLCLDAFDARAAYSSGKGYVEYLHQPGAGGADGDDLSHGVR